MGVMNEGRSRVTALKPRSACPQTRALDTPASWFVSGCARGGENGGLWGLLPVDPDSIVGALPRDPFTSEGPIPPSTIPCVLLQQRQKHTQQWGSEGRPVFQWFPRLPLHLLTPHR